jgi:hypothetical protein
MTRLILIAILLLSSGCAYTTPRYSISANSVEAIRTLQRQNNQRINIGSFTSRELDNSHICRLAGPIEIPDNKSFASFIEDAITSELKIAEAYDAKSPNVLTAALLTSDFSSGMTDGEWFIKMEFAKADGRKFAVESTYKFDGNFAGDQACTKVAMFFPNAVQDLISKLVASNDFRDMFLSGKKAND